MKDDKPFYRSKKWLAYVVTLAALVGMVALRGPVSVLEYLAGAIALGLPTLLGVQGWADAKAVSALSKSGGGGG